MSIIRPALLAGFVGPVALMLCAGTALAQSDGLATQGASSDKPRSEIEVNAIKMDDRQPPAVDQNTNDGAGTRAFDSKNIDQLAWLSLSDLPGNNSSGNDCWGYVSPSGREYAIMGVSRGYVFVEVTDPSNPNIIKFISGPNSLWHDVKVIGDHAYGVSEGGAGIQVIDLSNIDNGVVTLVKNKTQQGHSSTHNIVANPDSGYLYLTGANIQNGGLIAVDTTNPDDPTIVGAWNNMYVHDAQVVSYDSGPYAGKEIAFCFSGFSGGWSQTGLRIVDVTNKNNMFTISTVSWAGAQYAHQGWLSPDKHYLYVDDELDEGHTVSQTTTRVFDVSDLSNPIFMGTFSTGLPAIDHNLYTKDNLIFETNYRSGLRIFDATDPVNPSEIAYFDTYPNSDSANFNGAWSNYPYFPSGTIIVSDIERGLFILKMSCIADFNNDGTVNTQDVTAFLNAWTSQDSSADINGDTIVNTQDALAFLNYWTTGCN